MNWLDGSDDDVDPRTVDTWSRITVHQLLEREGYRPLKSRMNRPLTGAVVLAAGAMVGGLLMTQPLGTTLASGAAGEVGSASALPAGSVGPHAGAGSAHPKGVGAGDQDNGLPPEAGGLPWDDGPGVGIPGLPGSVLPPWLSIGLGNPRSGPGGQSPQLPGVQPVLASVVAPVVEPATQAVAPVVTPVTRAVAPVVAPVVWPVTTTSTSSTTVTQLLALMQSADVQTANVQQSGSNDWGSQQQFSWFDGGGGNDGGGHGGHGGHGGGGGGGGGHGGGGH
ncbi:MAG TPA: hypothetical protein VH333_18740 [Pseudonocardiaceae bacterium]|nr:hypothetical protein [Pseudonocardiaceae bacterium]